MADDQISSTRGDGLGAVAPGLESLALYDTRLRSVQPFVARHAPIVGVYTCGPTVYAPQHLGNMRSQITPDLLVRVLRAAGYQVTWVTNITDVGHLVSDGDDGDDKMEAAARRSGQGAAEIAAAYTRQWSDDRARLGCLEPDQIPKAADHISEQIEMVSRLEQLGHTYVIADGVYFDTATWPSYVEFAGLRLDDLEATGRIDSIAAKRQPADFALWKLTPPGVARQQEWDSQWGRGFPGWHIECSAMATKYLGSTFDIHTGGIDHVRVHHSNEIAQSECALGVHPWVGYWLHTEFLDLGGEKISKSKGHVLTVDSLVSERIDPLAFRYFILGGHYRQKQSFSFDSVRSSGKALDRLVRFAAAGRDSVGDADLELVALHARKFWKALAEDLNTPRGLAVVWDAMKADGVGDAERAAFLLDVDRGLGLSLGSTGKDKADLSGTDERIDRLVSERSKARAAKDFARSDAIRDELAAEGIEVVDTFDGPTWKRH